MGLCTQPKSFASPLCLGKQICCLRYLPWFINLNIKRKTRKHGHTNIERNKFNLQQNTGKLGCLQFIIPKLNKYTYLKCLPFTFTTVCKGLCALFISVIVYHYGIIYLLTRYSVSSQKQMKIIIVRTASNVHYTITNPNIQYRLQIRIILYLGKDIVAINTNRIRFMKRK